MCTGGRILNHLKAFVGSPDTTVMIVGWQGKGTTGRQLVDGAKTIEIDGQTFPVSARTATLNGFSAHADRPALLEWAGSIPKNGTKWFVNHGEDRAAEAPAEGIESAGLVEGVAVDRGVRLVV
jgi:metallo-beta-lactamase family protein